MEVATLSAHGMWLSLAASNVHCSSFRQSANATSNAAHACKMHLHPPKASQSVDSDVLMRTKICAVGVEICETLDGQACYTLQRKGCRNMTCFMHVVVSSDMQLMACIISLAGLAKRAAWVTSSFCRHSYLAALFLFCHVFS